MDTFQRVKRWLAAALDISVQLITPQSTLGDLFRHRPRTVSPEDEPRSTAPLQGGTNPDSLDLVELVMLFEEEFELEFPDAGTEALAGVFLDLRTTVQQIVEMVDSHMHG